ncbi:MAG: hypothetical protein HRF46_09635 [Acidobacteriota bacterium]
MTSLSRLPPGALSLAAVRTAQEKGLRAATVFLAGALAAEVAVTIGVLAGLTRLPVGLLAGEGAGGAALSLGLAAAGLVMLWPSARSRRDPRPWQKGATAAAGFGLALTTPGLWSWWATVGVVLLAAGVPSAGGMALGTALAAGLATSHLLLLAGIRSFAIRMPHFPDPLRLRLGVVLLAIAGLLAMLTLGPA